MRVRILQLSQTAIGACLSLQPCGGGEEEIRKINN